MRRARLTALVAAALLVVTLAATPGIAEAGTPTPCPTIADANASANPPGPVL